MTLRADSYSSTSEVKAYTRHLLGGQSAYNSTTRPTATELERFIDRASGLINAALRGAGLSDSSLRSNSTAKLACDDWVTNRATAYVELTQRGEGFSGQEGSRHGAFINLLSGADEFVKSNYLGWARLGVTVSNKVSDGLQFTGLTAKADRTDPSDTSLEQPLFERGLFDESAVNLNQT